MAKGTHDGDVVLVLLAFLNTDAASGLPNAS